MEESGEFGRAMNEQASGNMSGKIGGEDSEWGGGITVPGNNARIFFTSRTRSAKVQRAKPNWEKPAYEHREGDDRSGETTEMIQKSTGR